MRHGQDAVVQPAGGSRGLLWGTLWRSASWGVLAGAAIGGLYGGLLAPLTVLVEAALGAAGAVAGEEGRSLQQTLAALAALAGLFPFGAVYGVLIGAPLGLALGLATGATLGSLAHARLLPRARGRRRTVCAATSVALAVVLGSPLLAWVRFTPGWSDSAAVDYVLLTTVPTGLAGLAAWWTARRMADWQVAASEEPSRRRLVLLPHGAGAFGLLGRVAGVLLVAGPGIPGAILLVGMLGQAIVAMGAARDPVPPVPGRVSIRSLPGPPGATADTTMHGAVWLRGAIVADVTVTGDTDQGSGRARERRLLVYALAEDGTIAPPEALALGGDPACRFITRREPQALPDGRVALVQSCQPHSAAPATTPPRPSGNVTLVAATLSLGDTAGKTGQAGQLGPATWVPQEGRDGGVRQVQPLLPYALPDDTRAVSLAAARGGAGEADPIGVSGITGLIGITPLIKEGGGVAERFWRVLPDRLERLDVPLQCTGLPSLSPDGRTVALTGMAKQAGRDCTGDPLGSLYVWSGEDTMPRALAGGFRLDAERRPAWSPDGRWIALPVRVPWNRPHARGGERAALWLVEAATGTVYRPLPDGWWATAPSWAPDGRTLLVAGANRSRAPQPRRDPPQLHLLDLSSLPGARSP